MCAHAGTSSQRVHLTTVWQTASCSPRKTHKFESRYLDSLIGPYPKDKATYEKRSPINSIDQFSDPVIFFQVGILNHVLTYDSLQCPLTFEKLQAELLTRMTLLL